MFPNLGHAVEDNQELPHARGAGDFLGFASIQHLLVKLADHWVVLLATGAPM